MPALPVDALAPTATLKTLEGTRFPLDLQRGQDPVVLAFFKVSCPVCQYAFPYLERVYQAHRSGPAKFFAVSQDPRSETEAFIQKFGVRFQVLLDDPSGYPVSNAFGLTTVPTVFLIQGGRVVLSSVGWAKSEIQELSRHLASGGKAPEIFKPAEEIAAYKAG